MRVTDGLLLVLLALYNTFAHGERAANMNQVLHQMSEQIEARSRDLKRDDKRAEPSRMERKKRQMTNRNKRNEEMKIGVETVEVECVPINDRRNLLKDIDLGDERRLGRMDDRKKRNREKNEDVLQAEKETQNTPVRMGGLLITMDGIRYAPHCYSHIFTDRVLY